MTASPEAALELVSLSEDQAAALRDASEALADLARGAAHPLRVTVGDRDTGREVATILTSATVDMLATALANLAAGHRVALVPLATDTNTEEAAHLLGVSDAYLSRLLESGALPYDIVDGEPRVSLDALRRYIIAYQDAAMRALESMTAEAQRLGLYE